MTDDAATPGARLLAIDLGDRRTGLAVGDRITGIVSPAGVLEVVRERLIDPLAKAIAEHAPDALVLGIPLNMDGTEGPRARIARDMATALEERTGLPVVLQDERLTSFAADQAMARSGRTHGQKKKLRDALAAVAILEDYLAAGTRETESEQ